ncbi:uncharacterized protein H6S33_001084 [Morchella sextelata]|jgi:hypothetical protein|uniref:uncharacterized protein n=1 Tax=Morchella sextelata TaxID=1174677 RepID=UPI001D0441AD|nr:uncharacterized protein H6S33_001084 [Morchella sextelata]KAH0608856.1 hypothetical protein H6S33_001084 [Morchella sextelata]
MDPVGLSVGLLTTVAALVCKVHEMIAQAEIAGDQFKDLTCEFKRTEVGLNCLEMIFKTSTLSRADVDEYSKKLAGYTKDLQSIGTQLKQIRGNLSSRKFFRRYSQKRELMDGELGRLKSLIVDFNSSLSFLATTYNCVLSDRAHAYAKSADERLGSIESQLNRLEFKTEKNLQSIRVDIDLNLQYVQAVIQLQQEEPDYSIPLPKYEKYESKQPMFILTDKDTPGAVTPYTTPSTPRVVPDSAPRVPLGPGPSFDEAFRTSDWYVTCGLQGAEDAQNDYWRAHELQQASAV